MLTSNQVTEIKKVVLESTLADAKTVRVLPTAHRVIVPQGVVVVDLVKALFDAGFSTLDVRNTPTTVVLVVKEANNG